MAAPATTPAVAAAVAAAGAAAPAAAEVRPSVRRDTLLEIERGVQQAWEAAKIFEAEAKDAKTRKLEDKYLATFPYPYSQSRTHALPAALPPPSAAHTLFFAMRPSLGGNAAPRL
jgi:hypothetical protein